MPKQRGVNGLDIKNQNRGLLLRLLATGTARSRSELTKMTSLTKMTVSNIITEFLENGILTETEPLKTAHAGRKPVVLRLAEHAPRVIGIYLSRDALMGVISTVDCRILLKEMIPLESETQHSLTEKLFLLTDQLIAKTKADVTGIGVAAIGPVDAQSGTLLSPTNFFGIKNLKIKELLQKRYHLPVVVNNDMNASALAEKLFGCGKDYQNFIYLGLSNGIGAGIVCNHRLYYDKNGFAGEFGHMSIQYDGNVCSCGRRGCLELYANMPVVCTQLQNLLGMPDCPEPTQLTELYRLPEGKAFIDSVAQKLATGLTNIANLLSPQAIIIGHDGYFLPEEALRTMERTINQEVLFSGYQTLRISRSAFKSHAPLYGAVCCMLDAIFQGKEAIGEATH